MFFFVSCFFVVFCFLFFFSPSSDFYFVQEVRVQSGTPAPARERVAVRYFVEETITGIRCTLSTSHFTLQTPHFSRSTLHTSHTTLYVFVLCHPLCDFHSGSLVSFIFCIFSALIEYSFLMAKVQSWKWRVCEWAVWILSSNLGRMKMCTPVHLGFWQSCKHTWSFRCCLRKTNGKKLGTDWNFEHGKKKTKPGPERNLALSYGTALFGNFG